MVFFIIVLIGVVIALVSIAYVKMFGIMEQMPNTWNIEFDKIAEMSPYQIYENTNTHDINECYFTKISLLKSAKQCEKFSEKVDKSRKFAIDTWKVGTPFEDKWTSKIEAEEKMWRNIHANLCVKYFFYDDDIREIVEKKTEEKFSGKTWDGCTLDYSSYTLQIDIDMAIALEDLYKGIAEGVKENYKAHNQIRY